MKEITGGVCAAKGFKAGGVHCGVRANKTKKDIALILSDSQCTAASVYTTNLVKGAPLTVTKANIADGYAQAIICNSGNANTCNSNGIETAQAMCALVAQHTDIAAGDVVVASTGVIGQPLSLVPIASGLDALCAAVSASAEGSDAAAQAIMTTDTLKKEISFAFTLSGVECHIGGIAKGSGMIHPNMATMLVFVTTDAAISAPMLNKALHADVQDSFNMVSVDGDSSTNDMVTVLANGQAGNPEIQSDGQDFKDFCAALNAVTRYLSRMIAKDGEGATKLIICKLTGAVDVENARRIAKSVICSNLFKAAMFGADANWGRVLCAIGYSGAQVDVDGVNVSFTSRAGSVGVCENGRGIPFSEEIAKKVLSEDEIEVHLTLHDGEASAEAWGCDLSYDYVKINGDYRT